MIIGEVAARAGIRSSALRYYESTGLLPAPKRVNGRRSYGEDVFRRLTAIKVAREAGFTISEVRTLLGGVEEGEPISARWRELAQQKLGEVEALIERAQGMKRLLEEGLECGCVSFDDCGLLQRSAVGG
jgi:MerR family redox-sensitive transcriptional activator SoxR